MQVAWMISGFQNPAMGVQTRNFSIMTGDNRKTRLYEGVDKTDCFPLGREDACED
jgi:hypothetical protein